MSKVDKNKGMHQENENRAFSWSKRSRRLSLWSERSWKHTLVACMLPIMLFASMLFVPMSVAHADIANENLVDPTQRADNSFIYDTTIESLFEQSSLYDERIVQVTGEVIGDCIRAAESENYWITLTVLDAEDKTTISVLMSEDQASQIDHYGKYGVRGTVLQVRGTYHQACGEHDGLADIHATNSAVISKGYDSPDEFDIHEFLPGLVGIVTGLALMGVFLFVRERTR